MYVYIYVYLYPEDSSRSYICMSGGRGALKPVFHQKSRSRWVIYVYPTQKKLHKQHEMYMANVSPNARGPNATYIPPACVGGRVGSEMLHVGSAMLRVGSTRLFGYQHVGIGNANYSLWGSSPTRAPNASIFALQWNIGLMVLAFDISLI